MINNYLVVKKVFFTTFLLVSFLTANDFENYLKKEDNDFSNFSQNKQFFSYKKSIEKQFEEYKSAFNIELDLYKQDILKCWDTTEISTNHKWVQYDKEFQTKKSVDFKNQNINLEVLAKNEKDARQKILKLFKELLKDDIKTAYENNQLEKNIYKRLNKSYPVITKKQPIVKDIIDKKSKQEYIKIIKNKPIEKIKKRNKFIYKVSLKMPSKSLIKKARLYVNDVNSNGIKQKIKPSLIYAVIHSESSFNPMARSHIPAFGLMQIVPKSAGIDSYYFLYGKKKVLPSSYLYNAKNNIKIGSAYLHILYYRYLKDIEDPTSKLLCTICAYNTGAKNVARSFTKNSNTKNAFKIINTMTSNQVYKKLMRTLPYMETRKYLKKVYDRTFIYEKLLKNKELL